MAETALGRSQAKRQEKKDPRKPLNTNSVWYKLRVMRYQQEVVNNSLDLSEKRMYRLPPGLTECVNLTSLSLSKNSFTTLPETIGAFKKLEKLYLSNNELAALPSQIAVASSLTILNIETNCLKALPNEFCSLIKLKELHLSNNKITQLPAGFSALRELQIVTMESNGLTSFPDISEWKEIQILRLSMNELKEFPKVSKTHSKLIEIQLNGNHIESLPDGLSFAANLEIFELSWNKLKDLPKSLLSLKDKLKIFKVEGNPFSSVPAGIKEEWDGLAQKIYDCGPTEQATVLSAELQQKIFTFLETEK